MVFLIATMAGPRALRGLDPAGAGEARRRRADRVLVEKEAHRLTLWRGGKILRTYRIALGRRPSGDKVCKGDHKTPEGFFTIDSHLPASAFHRALHVSYPDNAHRNAARRHGCDPGGSIMIHGIKSGLGWLGPLHRMIDWTDGCMAVTDREIEEIYAAVPNGTPVEIRP
ncbi:MAG TPA: L,D-transpeptidase family protein [Thermoanaerobaculia bacterium]|nr:L,D-transpeptidase family protein [Thermoanaerobaculia bacterium]